MTSYLDIEGLKRWFQENKRDLPWRVHCSPYAVWISEVMLQQTQVAVVIDYFHRWMERFPTLLSLAKAPLSDVIKLWEGLGYYSRARMLHTAAQQILQNYQGELPDKREELATIKGIGPYTQGAILSFAFHQKAPAVDGNVKRVISRLFQIEEDISKAQTLEKIQLFVERLLPDAEPWIVMEALIELGAVICQKKPKCHVCPLRKGCLGFQNGKAEHLPVKAKKQGSTLLIRHVAVICHQQKFLVFKGAPGKVMADLYEFPYFEVEEAPSQGEIEKWLGSLIDLIDPMQEVRHTFTRYRVRLFPSRWESLNKVDLAGYEWVEKKDLFKLPFSSGHRRILVQLD